MLRLTVLTVLLGVALAPAAAHAASTVTVADPGGGARWSATASSAGDGRVCVQLRRGTKGKGRRCARLDGRLAYAYTVRTDTAVRPRDSRTVLLVTLAPDVVRATLTTPDGPRTYRRRAGRPPILLAVLAGRVERPPLRVEVQRGGQRRTVVEGPPPTARVPDPLGGPVWRSVFVAGSGGGVCATWERAQARYGRTPDPARGTPRCGSPEADLPVAAAQLVDGRLVVFGVAGEQVRQVVLRGLPTGDRPVALEPKTRALLAVVRGGSDPAALRLVATLADGRVAEKPATLVR